MDNLKKNINIPTTYDPTAFKKLFEQLVDGTQSKYLSEVESVPKDSDGKNNEMRIEKTTGKLYIKIGGTWKAFSPD